ncbi:IclR family transcriptional regulator [Desulfosediminicola ganghwensis]|uniref:IclR family transcriptional regulator n=1 Tax=Desulfosediminicola ganghwensis TaxID=2569540 RepID=UPI0010ACB625|nr:IclR family transcriptional regulator [Desulfosediminicola ganghwensis]
MKINRTTHRATEILKLLAQCPEGLTVTEIGERLKLPKTSTFDIVRTLKMALFLRESSNRYYIGFMANEVGTAYAGDKELYGVAKPHILKLSDQMKMASSLVVFEGIVLNYVFEHTPKGAIITPASSNTKDFLHASASGKVLLSYMTDAKQKKVLSKLKFSPFTDNTITSKDAFIEELKTTLKRGYGVDDREWNDLVTCVSVPIFIHKKVIAAMTLSGLQIASDVIPGVADKLKNVSQIITEEIG